MAVRRILVGPDLGAALGPQPEGVEVGVAGTPLGLGSFEAAEVLVVTGDGALLAEAGRLGVQRLVAHEDPAATVAAVHDLVAFLDR